MTLHIIEIARVTPATDSDSVDNSLEIPLTCFDLPWLLFSPVSRVFFYKLTESTRDHFHNFILPNLKLSLSLVLRSYLPLCGHVTWKPNEPKPSIVVSENDAVLVTIAESDSDFDLLSGYGQRAVSELHSLLPELLVSDDSATAFSIKITFFQNQGFSIAVAAHHAVLDGKTSSMFIKAWAHICKSQIGEIGEDGVSSSSFSLPENLTPSYDRSLLKDLIGVDEEMIAMLRSLKGDETKTSRSLTPFPAKTLGDDVVFATLVLSREDIEGLKERVKKSDESPSRDLNLHLSTFVVSYAYMWSCFLKSRGGGDGEERSVSVIFVGDFRERLDPPLSATYFGNCMFPACSDILKAEEFAEEKGFAKAVEIISDLVKGISSRKVETIAKVFDDCFDTQKRSQLWSVAGSTRLRVYESDFGWGKPVKVDILSIGGEAVSIAERRDVSGGVEMGMCLKKTVMDIVVSIFNNGLQKLEIK